MDSDYLGKNWKWARKKTGEGNLIKLHHGHPFMLWKAAPQSDGGGSYGDFCSKPIWKVLWRFGPQNCDVTLGNCLANLFDRAAQEGKRASQMSSSWEMLWALPAGIAGFQATIAHGKGRHVITQLSMGNGGGLSELRCYWWRAHFVSCASPCNFFPAAPLFFSRIWQDLEVLTLARWSFDLVLIFWCNGCKKMRAWLLS